MFLQNSGLKSKIISRTKSEISPEEILWDSLAQKKEEIFEKRIEVPLRKWPLKLVFVLFFCLILFVSVKSLQFQYFDYDKYVLLAEKNNFVSTVLKAERGVIYDRNFKQLVFNKPAFDLVFKKDEFKTEENVLKKIAWILEKDKTEIKNLINQAKENIVVGENLSYKQLILFESSSEELKGFEVQNATVREYVDGEIFSHIIGYHRKTGQDVGLENYYNYELSSRAGEVRYERDVYGEFISKEVVFEAESGNSLVLWVDSELQKKLYDVFSEEIKNINVSNASAIALDPKTGGVLAMVSLPSYDNNLFSVGISQEDWQRLSEDKNMPFLNRVISGRYSTGSIIKPLIASAALNETVINENTTINCEGQIVIENPWFKDQPYIFKDFRTHGITNVKKAIAESCNVFFYTIGGGYKEFKGLGPNLIKDYLSKFGWNQKLNIDLLGEVSGFIPDKEWKKSKFTSPDNLWMPGDTYNLSIGQGYLLVTPLEVVSSFASLINGGKLFKPQIVHQVIDKNKQVVKEFKPEIIRDNFIESKNLEIVKQGMKGTVDYGSAIVLNSLPVEAGAKTGTAEIGKDEHYHSWLTVFAPYDNPEIVITLMVEGAYGMHKAVAPTAKRVLNWYFGGEEMEEEVDK
jgi:penicillin-binding protein 2